MGSYTSSTRGASAWIINQPASLTTEISTSYDAQNCQKSCLSNADCNGFIITNKALNTADVKGVTCKYFKTTTTPFYDPASITIFKNGTAYSSQKGTTLNDFNSAVVSKTPAPPNPNTGLIEVDIPKPIIIAPTSQPIPDTDTDTDKDTNTDTNTDTNPDSLVINKTLSDGEIAGIVLAILIALIIFISIIYYYLQIFRRTPSQSPPSMF
jgi:hypothetical protein